ncbi:retropepsin-like aspartic protease [Ixodes scapularis]
MCTADAHTDDSGCADSTQTTRAPGMARQPLEVELPKTTDAKILHERRRAPTRTLPETETTLLQTVSNNLNVVIDGHDASALVDTGADYSVLSGRLSRRLRKVTTPWDGPQIRTAGRHLITPVGRCTARVEIHGETCPVKFVVLQDCSRDVILGMDFLCEYGAVIDLAANQLTLRKPVQPPAETNTTSTAIRVIADHVNLPPRSSVFVTVIITDAAMHGEALLEGSVQLLLEKGIGVAQGVTDLQEGRTTVLVTNFREEPQHLTKGTTVGHVEELQAPAVVAAISEETFDVTDDVISDDDDDDADAGDVISDDDVIGDFT